MRGRKPKYESRAAEFRQRLVAWKQTPESMRPSLRALARELQTSHALLQHYLDGLDEWLREKLLEPFRANAKAKGLTVTPALEKRYLAWLQKIEKQQERSRAMVAKAMPGLCKTAGVPCTGNLDVDMAAVDKAIDARLEGLRSTWG